MDIILKNLPAIITAIIALGVVWKFLSKGLFLLKEIVDLLQAIFIAFEDRKLTQDEIDNIVKEAKDIPVAIKKVLKKNGT